MWVFCCGMFRSGSTLQYNITRELVENYTNGTILGIDNGTQLPDISEMHRWLTSYAVLKIHIHRKEIDTVIANGNAVKGIYIYRDVRDVVVSWMNMRNQSFEDIDGPSFAAICVANYEAWTHLPHVLVSRYEDMMAGNLLEEVNRIARFLNIDITPQQANAIAQKNTLEQQKDYLNKFDFAHQGVHFDWTTYDPKTLMHKNHVQSSQSGRWQEKLTSAQTHLIEDQVGDWLQAHGYSLSPR